MSVILCNNNLWLHCVSIGIANACGWPLERYRTVPCWIWVEGRVGGGRIARMMAGAGTERNGMERVERMDGWVRWLG